MGLPETSKIRFRDFLKCFLHLPEAPTPKEKVIFELSVKFWLRGQLLWVAKPQSTNIKCFLWFTARYIDKELEEGKPTSRYIDLAIGLDSLWLGSIVAWIPCGLDHALNIVLLIRGCEFIGTHIVKQWQIVFN